MSRTLLAPGWYVQGAGAISEIGIHASKLGAKTLLHRRDESLVVSAQAIQECLGRHKVGYHVDRFNGECAGKGINRLAQVANTNGADLSIASGCAKAINSGKAVAHEIVVSSGHFRPEGELLSWCHDR